MSTSLTRIDRSPAPRSEALEAREEISDERKKQIGKAAAEMAALMGMVDGMNPVERELFMKLSKDLFENQKNEGAADVSDPADGGRGQEVVVDVVDEGDAEQQEVINQYDAMTLEKAMSGSSEIKVDDGVMAALREAYGDNQASVDIALSMLLLWNSSTNASRIAILSGKDAGYGTGMKNVLAECGLIKISAETASEEGGSEEGSEENSEEEGSEEGAEEESEEEKSRKEAIEAFLGDEQKAFWLDKKGITRQEMMDQPDTYTVEKMNELGEEYEKDRKELARELSNKDFLEWFKNKFSNGEGRPSVSLQELFVKGHKDLYELKAQFESDRDAVESGPLVAAGLSSKAEIERKAEQIAKKELEDKLVAERKKGFIKGKIAEIWHGGIRRQSEILSRKDELVKMIREKNALQTKKDAKIQLTPEEANRLGELDSIVGEKTWVGCEGDVERFILAQCDDTAQHIRRDKMIRKEKGERMDVFDVSYDENHRIVVKDENGNIVDENNEKAKRAASIYRAVRVFATCMSNVEKGVDVNGNPRVYNAEQKAQYEAACLGEFRACLAGLRVNGEDDSDIDNYEKIALEAAKRAKHGKAIENVMEGFRVIEGDIYRGASTEVHKNAIDRIAGKLSSVPIVPTAVAGAAAWAIYNVAGRRGLGSIASVSAGLAGGAIVGGAFAALDRADKMKEQYATAAIEIASGGGLDKNGRLEAAMTKNIEAFMKREDGTKVTAELLTSEINANLSAFNAAYEQFQANPSAENRQKLLEASTKMSGSSAEAENRLKMSDEYGRDLVGFTGGGNLSSMEKQRTDLWVSVAKAETALAKVNGIEGMSVNYADIMKKAREPLEKARIEAEQSQNGHVAKEKIKAFLGAAGLSLAFGAVIEEVASWWNPNVVGVAETRGLVKMQNNEGANKTLAAGIIEKLKGGGKEYSTRNLVQSAEFSTEQAAEQYQSRNGGLIGKRENPAKDKFEEVFQNTNEYTLERNGGSINPPRQWCKGNEQRLFGGDGKWHIDMKGVSRSPSGDVYNVPQLQNAGQLEMLVTVNPGDVPIACPINRAGEMVIPSDLPEVLKNSILEGRVQVVEVVSRTVNPGKTVVFASQSYGAGESGMTVSVGKQLVEKGYDYVVVGMKKVTEEVTKEINVGWQSMLGVTAGLLRGNKGLRFQNNERSNAEAAAA